MHATHSTRISAACTHTCMHTLMHMYTSMHVHASISRKTAFMQTHQCTPSTHHQCSLSPSHAAPTGCHHARSKHHSSSSSSSSTQRSRQPHSRASSSAMTCWARCTPAAETGQPSTPCVCHALHATGEICHDGHSW